MNIYINWSFTIGPFGHSDKAKISNVIIKIFISLNEQDLAAHCGLRKV